MEAAIFLDGTSGSIIPEDMRFEDVWTCDYQGRTFEYHNNLWMEIE